MLRDNGLLTGTLGKSLAITVAPNRRRSLQTVLGPSSKVTSSRPFTVAETPPETVREGSQGGSRRSSSLLVEGGESWRAGRTNL